MRVFLLAVLSSILTFVYGSAILQDEQPQEDAGVMAMKSLGVKKLVSFVKNLPPSTPYPILAAFDYGNLTSPAFQVPETLPFVAMHMVRLCDNVAQNSRFYYSYATSVNPRTHAQKIIWLFLNEGLLALILLQVNQLKAPSRCKAESKKNFEQMKIKREQFVKLMISRMAIVMDKNEDKGINILSRSFVKDSLRNKIDDINVDAMEVCKESTFITVPLVTFLSVIDLLRPAFYSNEDEKQEWEYADYILCLFFAGADINDQPKIRERVRSTIRKWPQGFMVGSVKMEQECLRGYVTGAFATSDALSDFLPIEGLIKLTSHMELVLGIKFSWEKVKSVRVGKLARWLKTIPRASNNYQTTAYALMLTSEDTVSAVQSGDIDSKTIDNLMSTVIISLSTGMGFVGFERLGALFKLLFARNALDSELEPLIICPGIKNRLSAIMAITDVEERRAAVEEFQQTLTKIKCLLMMIRIQFKAQFMELLHFDRIDGAEFAAIIGAGFNFAPQTCIYFPQSKITAQVGDKLIGSLEGYMDVSMDKRARRIYTPKFMQNPIILYIAGVAIGRAYRDNSPLSWTLPRYLINALLREASPEDSLVCDKMWAGIISHLTSVLDIRKVPFSMPTFDSPELEDVISDRPAHIKKVTISDESDQIEYMANLSRKTLQSVSHYRLHFCRGLFSIINEQSFNANRLLAFLDRCGFPSTRYDAHNIRSLLTIPKHIDSQRLNRFWRQLYNLNPLEQDLFFRKWVHDFRLEYFEMGQFKIGIVELELLPSMQQADCWIDPYSATLNLPVKFNLRSLLADYDQ